jgi:hypothetical protein
MGGLQLKDNVTWFNTELAALQNPADFETQIFGAEPTFFAGRVITVIVKATQHNNIAALKEPIIAAHFKSFLAAFDSIPSGGNSFQDVFFRAHPLSPRERMAVASSTL